MDSDGTSSDTKWETEDQRCLPSKPWCGSENQTLPPSASWESSVPSTPPGDPLDSCPPATSHLLIACLPLFFLCSSLTQGLSSNWGPHTSCGSPPQPHQLPWCLAWQKLRKCKGSEWMNDCRSSCLNSQGGWSQERSAILALVLSGSPPQSRLVFIHVSRFGSRPSLLKILGPKGTLFSLPHAL